MNKWKSFKIYYLLICEGSTEFNIFAYLTKVKFRILFDNSNIKFSDKVQMVEGGISKGKLNGANSFVHFKSKYNCIKNGGKYKGQKLFFILDKDINDSQKIENLIIKGGDIVQFVEYNSEHLLLKLAGKNPKNPSDFKNLKDFRDYCKNEFLKQFKKEASKLKDPDFDSIFSNVNDEEIKNCFNKLFSTIEIN